MIFFMHITSFGTGNFGIDPVRDGNQISLRMTRRTMLLVMEVTSLLASPIYGGIDRSGLAGLRSCC